MKAPENMQALLVDAVNSSFRLIDLPVPKAQAGEVLVRIKASGVNPLDGKIRTGKAGHARQPLPAVLGMDLAGIVETLGEGVTRFDVGDEVYGMATGIGGIQGSLAQFAAVDAELLAHKPRNVDMREAAALPLVFITAWEGLIDRAALRAGQTVLVQGGAGGVGHIAVQIAQALGATVFATGSEKHKALIESFGATAIDYRTQTVEQYVAAHTEGVGFDVVYDTVGGATLDASFAAARTYGGHVVSCLGWGMHSLAPLSFRAATYSGVFTLLPLLSGQHRSRHGEILREATLLVEAGAVKPVMDDRHFTLETAQSAHDILEAGDARGRLVVDV